MNLDVVAWSGPSMGGRLDVRVAADQAYRSQAERDVVRVGHRVDGWASRLTRFAESSDLSRLNRDDSACSEVRPTLGAVLNWAWTAGERSQRVVDVTLLNARLAAEFGVAPADAGVTPDARYAPAPWKIKRSGRSSLVTRRPGTRFDLDGVAKGWIADRALALLCRWPGALVDADGDIALSVAPDADWHVTVDDPRRPDGPPLAVLRIASPGAWHQSVGVATSGTTVHQWPSASAGNTTHHLIDPRTGRSAVTDVVQATVAAPTAAEAEVLAKSAVILGSTDGALLLERSACLFGLLLLTSGETILLPTVKGSAQ